MLSAGRKYIPLFCFSYSFIKCEMLASFFLRATPAAQQSPRFFNFIVAKFRRFRPTIAVLFPTYYANYSVCELLVQTNGVFANVALLYFNNCHVIHNCLFKFVVLRETEFINRKECNASFKIISI